MRKRVAAADEIHMVAASLEAWTASRASNPARNLAMVYGLIFGIPLVLALVLVGLHQANVWSVSRGAMPALALGGGSALGVVLYLGWYFTGRAHVRARKTELERARVACPDCGAPGMLTPGDAVDRCRYCDAALVPTQPIMASGVDAARVALRKAALDRRRAQRDAVARATNMGAFAILMPVMMIGSLILMVGGTAVGYSVQMARGKEAFHPGVLVVWALTIAIVGAVYVYRARKRQRRERLREALRDVVSQLGGAVITEVSERVAWLNRYWSGGYEQRNLFQTYVASGATVEVGGFAALVDVDLNASKPPPRIDLFIAAWVPEVSEGKQPSARVKDKALSGLGFHVRKTEGGLVAHANQELLQAARRDPDAVHVVVPALAHLVRVAGRVGCQTIGPLDGSASTNRGIPGSN